MILVFGASVPTLAPDGTLTSGDPRFFVVGALAWIIREKV